MLNAELSSLSKLHCAVQDLLESSLQLTKRINNYNKQNLTVFDDPSINLFPPLVLRPNSIIILCLVQLSFRQ